MATDERSCEQPRRWFKVSAWLWSLALHLAAAVLGILLVQPTLPTQSRDEHDRPAGIVLVRRTGATARYFDEQTVSSHSSASAAATTPGDSSNGDPLSELSTAPGAAGISLPKWPGGLPPGESIVPGIDPATGRGRPKLPFPTIDEAAVLAEDALVPREVQPTGPTARLALFGAAAEGRSFVLVIDRSQSMGGDGLGAIAAAASELAVQVGSLTAEQTFQVVGYNQSAAYFSGRHLIPATDENKAAAVKFVGSMVAVGPTEHDRGLRAALRLGPEVIFLLTDGGDPHLKPAECAAITGEAAGRTSIHVLHFGRGREGAASGDHFLRRLAGENRGSYLYIDLAK
jgi:hypothetical protein